MRAALCLLLLTSCTRHIEPVTVNALRSDAQVERGRYLSSSVMACGGCHARRDWAFHTGPMKEGTELAGSGDIARDERFSDKYSFSAPNLTPHYLGAWSDGELSRAIVFGQSRDGRGLFPYMPYFEYREALARDDLAALVSYLRTVPPVAWQAPGPPRFPMSKFALNRLPEERPLREKAPSPGAPEYGKYLTEIAGCMGCHTQADHRGRPVGAPYAGGREFPVPAPGAGTVRASNLTPDDETGLGRWTKEQFVARFKGATLGAARALPVEAGGFNSVMPWWAWSGLSERDLGAMYDYLRSLPAAKNPVVRYSPPAK